MSEFVRPKLGTRLVSAAVSAALVVGLAPSFAGADRAFAAGGGSSLAGSELNVQADKSDLNWVNVYGGAGESKIQNLYSLLKVDSFESAIELSDGRMLAAGVLDKSGLEGVQSTDQRDAALVFYDASGVLINSVSVGSSGIDEFSKAIETSTGDIVAVGCAGAGNGEFKGVVPVAEANNQRWDAIACKFDSNGKLNKAVSLGGSSKDQFRDVIELPDGSFLAVGYEASKDLEGGEKASENWENIKSSRNVLVAKIPADFSKIEILDIIGGSGSTSAYNEASAVIPAIGGGFVVVGDQTSNDYDFEGKHHATTTNNKADGFFALYDASGARVELKCFGGSDAASQDGITSTGKDYVTGIDYDYVDSSGTLRDTPTGYVLSGYATSHDGTFAGKRIASKDGAAQETAFLIRVNSQGEIQEVATYPSSVRSHAMGVKSVGSGYVIGGMFEGELPVADAMVTSTKYSGSNQFGNTFVGYVPGGRGLGLQQVSIIDADNSVGFDVLRGLAFSGDSILATGTTSGQKFGDTKLNGKFDAFIASLKPSAVLPQSVYQPIADTLTAIGKIPAESAITTADKATIEAAQAAYDKLHVTQQALVPTDKVALIGRAKSAYDAAAAKEEAARKAAEQAAAKAAADEAARKAAEEAAAKAAAEEAARKAAEEAAAHAVLAKGEEVTTGSGASAATVEATSSTEVAYVAPASKSKKKVTVPDTVTVNGHTYKVTAIQKNAFKGSKATSVTVGKNVKTVAAGAFNGAKSLKSVKLGKGVTKLSKGSFKGAKKLTKLTITSKKLTTKKALAGAFKGSKVKTVKLSGMTAKQKKAVKKAILKWGGKKSITVK